MTKQQKQPTEAGSLVEAIPSQQPRNPQSHRRTCAGPGEGAITIGQTDDGKPVKLKIGRLVVSRGLVSADSGGGKSWLWRKIIEEVSETSQTIVIDPEGEFASLREVRDMVLAGPDGEVPAEPRSAGLLCRKLMELNLSAVIDLSELTPRNRQEFLRGFCETMVALPKSLYRTCFVFVDEAHEFAPEGDQSVCEEALAQLSSKGRKRGYCLMCATQRLSKLSKNVAAGLKNQFLGTFSLDTDIKRAAGALGFDRSRYEEIRDLSSEEGREGEFFAFGLAFNHRGVVKMRAGDVRTSHPEPGKKKKHAPPEASAKIKGALGDLKDLAKQAEDEIRNLADARARIVELEREVRQAKNAAPAPSKQDTKRGNVAGELRTQLRQQTAMVAQLRKGLMEAMKVIANINSKSFEAAGVDPEQIKKAVEQATQQIVKLAEARIAQRNAEFERFKKEAAAALTKLQKLLDQEQVEVSVDVTHQPPYTVQESQATPTYPTATDLTGRSSLTAVERDVLDAAASFPGGATRQRISIFSGRSIKSSSFQASFSGGECDGDKRPSLVQAGLLALDGDRYAVTEKGAAMAKPTKGTTIDDWLKKLQPVEADVLKCFAARVGHRLTRDQVSEATGRSASSSSFQSAFPALRELGLIEGVKDYSLTPEAAAQAAAQAA